MLVALDLEGVLIPEIWFSFAEKTGIEKLKLTTRDISNYDELMKGRLKILNENNLTQRLADDERVPLDFEEIEGVLNDPESFVAFAIEQAEDFAAQVRKWTERFPEAKELLPQELL